MEFRKIIEDLDQFQTIMMVEMKDNPELSCTIEKFSNNLHKIYDEVFFQTQCQVSIRDLRSGTHGPKPIDSVLSGSVGS